MTSERNLCRRLDLADLRFDVVGDDGIRLLNERIQRLGRTASDEICQ